MKDLAIEIHPIAELLNENLPHLKIAAENRKLSA
jgi:hypothetical protein